MVKAIRFIVPIAITFLQFSAAAAQTLKNDSEYCTGFNPDSQTWGLTMPRELYQHQACSPGMAIMYTTFSVGDAEKWLILESSCCPVPKDSLTPEHVWSRYVCPEGSVATGTRLVPPDSGETKVPLELRCSMVNTATHELGKPTSATRIDFGRADLVPNGFFDRILAINRLPRVSRAQIPSRYSLGFGRQTAHSSNGGGCLGRPWGSVLTGVTGHRCVGQTYREIIRRSPPK